MKKVINKIINFIVDKKYLFIFLFIGLAITSIFLIPKVKVNYDMTTYLEEGTITREAYDLMIEEFSSNGAFFVMVEDVTVDEALTIEKEMNKVNGISSIVFDENSTAYYHDGYALYGMYLTTGNFSQESEDAVESIQDLLSDYTFYLTGGAIESQFLGNAVTNNMVQILLWAVLIVLIILIINSTSWIEPLIFAIVIFSSILINMGTNVFLPSVSFITQSICAVMQLALAMDYSIMFLHRYMSERELDKDSSNKVIVKRALNQAIVPILGSSLTTIAGLLALVCMKFGIGIDIGLVLAKGIVISLFTVFFFMPGVLLIFSKLVEKTKHRNIYQLIRGRFPKFEGKIAKFQYKTRIIIPIVLGLLIIVGFGFYLKTNYAYTLEASNDPNSQINLDAAAIQEQFGVQNTFAVLVPNDGSLDKEKELVEYLINYEYNGEKVFNSIQGIVTIGIYDYYSSEELASQYGIPVDLVKSVYSNIDDSASKLQLITILNYLVDNDYIVSYTTKINDTINLFYDLSLKLDDTVTIDDLVLMVNKFSGVDNLFSSNNIKALLNDLESLGLSLNDLTVRKLLAFLTEKDYLNNILNSFELYCTYANNLDSYYSKVEVQKIFTLDDDNWNLIFESNNELLLSVIIGLIGDSYVSQLNSSELVVFNYYKRVNETKDVSLSSSEAASNDEFGYNVLPSLAFLAIYGLSSGSKTNYEIQYALANNPQISNSLKDISSELDNVYNNLLPLLNTEVTPEIVSNKFGISEDIVSVVFGEIGVASIYGSELLKSIVEGKIVSNYGNELNEQFQNAVVLVNYAISMFEGENYDRIVLNLKYGRNSEESMEITRLLRVGLDNYYNEYYVVSESSAFVDFEDSFSTDSIKINLISFLFILIIIAISFKSLSIPLILTVIIQGAIWLTMTVSVFEGTEVYFICYLMVICIQMGTTIDYGILYTSKYVEERKKHNRVESLELAFKASISTILTSGAILIIAAYVVGKISEVSIISSIGYLLSKGSLISVVFILLALPQVLTLCDTMIKKTTLGFNPFD